MAYHKIKERVEKTLLDYIRNNATGALANATYHHMFDDGEIVMPLIVAYVNKAEVQIFGSTTTGNYKLEATVALSTQYKDTNRAQHEDMSAQIIDLLFACDLKTELNKWANGCHIMLVQLGDINWDIDDDSRMTHINMVIKAMPQELASYEESSSSVDSSSSSEDNSSSSMSS